MMPELPDVESIIKKIKRRIIGRCILNIAIVDNLLTTRSNVEPVLGKKINSIQRRGKYILIYLSDDYTVVIHLRMTGDLLITLPHAWIETHTRLIVDFDDGRQLRFLDRRRLGVVYVVRDVDFAGIPGLSALGPEPLSEDFTLRSFEAMVHKRTGMIKSLLLDQGFIAGIGNIYGDEILYQSGIRPSTKAPDLTKVQIRRLYRKITYVLKKACEHNADLSGFKRWFVQGRDKGYCINCRNRLEKIRIQGRYSYYCPKCQR